MHIIIRGRNVPVSDTLEKLCRERVRRAVEPFAERVVRVEVVLVGAGALPAYPAYGCRAFITLDSGQKLMFATSDRNHVRALARATFGAGRHLARKVDKRRTAARLGIGPLDAA